MHIYYRQKGLASKMIHMWTSDTKEQQNLVYCNKCNHAIVRLSTTYIAFGSVRQESVDFPRNCMYSILTRNKERAIETHVVQKLPCQAPFTLEIKGTDYMNSYAPHVHPKEGTKRIRTFLFFDTNPSVPSTGILWERTALKIHANSNWSPMWQLYYLTL